MDLLDDEFDWSEREARWKEKLGRLRLDAEPIEEQLARLLRATFALSLVTSVVGVMFLAIFGAFHRPDVGGVLAVVLIAPVVAMCWIDYAILRGRALAYLREKATHDPKSNPPG